MWHRGEMSKNSWKGSIVESPVRIKNITSNYHYHTVEADSEETLDLIEQVLKEKGYLVSNTP